MHRLRNICLPLCLSVVYSAFVHGDAIADFTALRNLITITSSQVQNTVNVDHLILNRTLATTIPFVHAAIALNLFGIAHSMRQDATPPLQNIAVALEASVTRCELDPVRAAPLRSCLIAEK